MDKKFVFTKTAVEKLPIPESGRVTYHDAKFPGLQLRVSDKGKKVFALRTNLNGKTVRVTLGPLTKIGVDQARKLAKNHLGTLSEGRNPNAVKRAKLSRSVTLSQCLEEYLNSRTNLKPGTASSYKNALDKYVPDWMNTPLVQIRRDQVEARHRQIGAKSPTSANKVMRIVRALFEYAHGKYEDENGDPVILHNPVKRLSHAKAWFKESRRTTHIKTYDLKDWYKAVDTAPEWLDTPDPILVRDYLKLVLFTGLRRREAASLEWEWIDFQHRTLTIPETKNGHPHTLPLTDYLFDMLTERRKNGSKYVFPGPGVSGHYAEPKKSVANIRKKAGIYFTIHDLRRTFITIAEGLGIRDYTLKRLLNHRSSGDVTDGYIMTDVERLREPMQQITDFILAKVNEQNEKEEEKAND